MTKNLNLPKIDDFILEGEDFSGNVHELSDILSKLIESPNEYDKKINDFIETKLPPIWENILLSFHSLRSKAKESITKEIILFFEKYCQLCVHTDLIPSIVLTISTAFDSSYSQGNFYKIDDMSPDEIDNILGYDFSENSKDDVSILLPPAERPKAESVIATSVLSELIKRIIQSHIFLKTKELYEEKNLTIEKISAVDQVFTCIESSICKELVSAILPILIDTTINLIDIEYLSLENKAQNNQNDKMYNNLHSICKFLSMFARMLPQTERIDDILTILCKLSSENSPVKTRHISISGIIHIIDTVGFGNSAEMVKETMINALVTSSQKSMLNSVCNFLPKLAKFAEFTDDDIKSLLLQARSGEETIVSALVEVIESVHRDIDDCARELTNYDILCPSLYCSVIGKTRDESITRTLFNQLLDQTNKLIEKKGPIAHVVLNDRIKEHMNEEGVDSIKLLAFLFLCAPNVGTVCDFIVRVFNLPELPDDLIPMLRNFARKINDFDSTPSIITLFNALIERLKKKEALEKNGSNSQTKEEEEENYQQFTDSLALVVTEWIKISKRINSEAPKILKQLSELDFSLINNNVPFLANELISKCDQNTNIEFLFKVLKDTIPEKHSQWLIYSLFNLIHDNDVNVKKCFDIIIEHLQSIKDSETDNRKRFTNGVYLLYNAVIYEADFFKIGEQNYGFLQNFTLYLQDDNDTKITISLHPFHSTRRIFEEVGNALNIKTDQFQLILNNEDQDKELKYNVPLQTISTIGQFKANNNSNNNSNETGSFPIEITIELKVQNHDDYQPIPTPFLDLLAPKISILYDLIEYNINTSTENDGQTTIEYSIESEYLFHIIKLFPQLNIAAKNAIQEVITEKISLSNAMLFRDSQRIFPYAISCSINNFIKEIQLQNSQEMNENESEPVENEEGKEIIKYFIIELASHKYDIVSLSIACKGFHNIKFQVAFDEQNLKKCLIDCSSSQIRTITSKLVSPELTNRDSFIKLIDFALMKENRSKTEQFFECISQMNFDKEIFIPFYQKIEQFEFSYYSDIDQTFISLLRLIPQTQEMVELTLKRLFSPPTCRYETVPFVHTIESWKEALKFIETNLSIPRLHAYLSLLPLPQDLNQVKLSSDYTFKGRIGILNMGSTCYMNALLQVLNTFQGVTHSITSKDTNVSKEKTPFTFELRNCMAKLRYLRGTNLSLSQFAQQTVEQQQTNDQEDPSKKKKDTVKFDPTIQQDIGEFFEQVVNKISEELKEEDDVTNQMKIPFSNNVSVDNKIYSTKQDSTFTLSLQIENISNLSDAFDAYFEDEKIPEYIIDGEKVPASLWKSIQEWPNYLVIQLQRWSYNLETMEKIKLVHEFDFPVILKGDDIKIHHEEQRCNSDYTLSAVVIHKGTAEQGHYFAIVLGDDNEWYCCNDKLIEYFDINDLATWSFGQQATSDDSQSIEDVYTGYLLLYKKIGIDRKEIPGSQSNVCYLPPDLEQELNVENAKNWGLTIFYSEEFIDFARRMTLLYSSDLQMLDISFTVLFKIVVCDEKMLNQWTDMMIKDILDIKSKSETDELNPVYEKFFDFIENEIGTSLVHLFAITEKRTDCLSSIINFAISKVQNSTKPIRSIMKCVPDGQFLKRMFVSFVFETINNAYQTLKSKNIVKWTNEDETLKMMLNILSMQLSKEVQRNISKLHITAMNNVLGIFIDVAKAKGCNETVLSVFDIARMNKINYIYKKCNNFNKLMYMVNSMQNDVFYETADATPATLELLSQILPQENISENDSTEQLVLDLSFLFPCIEKLIFCKDQKIRKNICDYLNEMAGKKDIEMVNYYKEALIKEQFSLTLKEENTVSLFVIGQFPRMQKKIDKSESSKANDQFDQEEVENDENYYNETYPKEAQCIEFTDVILRLTYITPNALQNEFRTIVNMYMSSNHMVLKGKLLQIIHHIIAYDKSIINDENYTDLIEQILNTNVTSSYATQILWAFQDKANNSVLSGACVQYYLTSDYDENAELLIEMLQKGLQPAIVDIPSKANDIIKLRIANELWNVWPEEKHRELADFMLSAFHLARPYPLYQNSLTLSKTINLLKEFCQDELDSKLEEINKNMID